MSATATATVAPAAPAATELPEDLQTLRSLLEKAGEVYMGTLDHLEVEGDVPPGVLSRPLVLELPALRYNEVQLEYRVAAGLTLPQLVACVQQWYQDFATPDELDRMRGVLAKQPGNFNPVADKLLAPCLDVHELPPFTVRPSWSDAALDAARQLDPAQRAGVLSDAEWAALGPVEKAYAISASTNGRCGAELSLAESATLMIQLPGYSSKALAAVATGLGIALEGGGGGGGGGVGGGGGGGDSTASASTSSHADKVVTLGRWLLQHRGGVSVVEHGKQVQGYLAALYASGDGPDGPVFTSLKPDVCSWPSALVERQVRALGLAPAELQEEDDAMALPKLMGFPTPEAWATFLASLPPGVQLPTAAQLRGFQPPVNYQPLLVQHVQGGGALVPMWTEAQRVEHKARKIKRADLVGELCCFEGFHFDGVEPDGSVRVSVYLGS
jgi:hypothetical protein